MLVEMRKEAARILAKAKLGTDVQGEKKRKAQAKSETLGSVVERYIQDRVPELRPRTLEGFALHLRRHWQPLHGYGVEQITRRDIVATMEEIAEQHGKVAADRAKATLSGIRRTIGAAPLRKRAATSDMVIAMSATGTSLRALRDRAIILLGFAGAFRRSELVALNVA